MIAFEDPFNNRNADTSWNRYNALIYTLGALLLLLLGLLGNGVIL